MTQIENIEKDVKVFFKEKQKLLFLFFQLPSKDPFLNCKWHKKIAMDLDANRGANQDL